MNLLTYLRAKYIDEEGATATEYVFLLVFIALAIIIGAGLLGTELNSLFTDASNTVKDAPANPTG